jgi:hypothetical protein
MNIIFKVDLFRYSMVAGRYIAAAFLHGWHDPVYFPVDGILSLSQDSLIKTTTYPQIRILFCDLHNIAAGCRFKGTHVIHSDFLVQVDHRDCISIRVNLNMELAVFINLPELGICNQLLIIRE